MGRETASETWVRATIVRSGAETAMVGVFGVFGVCLGAAILVAPDSRFGAPGFALASQVAGGMDLWGLVALVGGALLVLSLGLGNAARYRVQVVGFSVCVAWHLVFTATLTWTGALDGVTSPVGPMLSAGHLALYIVGFVVSRKLRGVVGGTATGEVRSGVPSQVQSQVPSGVRSDVASSTDVTAGVVPGLGGLPPLPGPSRGGV